MSSDVPMTHISKDMKTVDDVDSLIEVSTHSRGDKRSFVHRMRHNVNVFVFFMCLYALVYGSLVTYLVAMVTSIEKRFDIPSSVSGFIIGSTEIGYLVGVLPISHYGVKTHRPRVLGVCGLLISFSAFLWALPYFIYGPLVIAGSVSTEILNKTTTDNADLCRDSSFKTNSSLVASNAALVSANGGANVNVVLFFFVFGGILNGIGSTPFFNIGVTFVDDHVSKVKASAYFGLLFCVRTIAPVIGFLIGGGLAAYPENILGETSISPEDPRFIGAWWVGFILLGAATAITAMPLLFFGRKLDKQVEADTSDDESDQTEKIEKIKPQLSNKRFSVAIKEVEAVPFSPKKEAIATFLVALKRMLTNPAIVLMTIGGSIDYLTFSSYGTFLPKYLEVHYERTAATANVIVGTVFALSAAFGTLIGGYLMSRFPMPLTKLVLYSTIVVAIISGTTIVNLFLSCPQLPLAGSPGSNGQWNNSMACNSNCSCSLDHFQPICNGNNELYMSPCAAACHQITDLKFSSCNCFANSTITAATGLCTSGCNISFIAFVVISFILNFITNVAVMPFAMASLRCVHANDKSLAMALLSFLSSLLGTGGSSLYGFIIDHACLFRGEGGKGTCVLYDRTKFRYLFIGVPLLSHIPSTVLFFLMYFALKRNLYMQLNDAEIKKDAEKKRGHKSARL